MLAISSSKKSARQARTNYSKIILNTPFLYLGIWAVVANAGILGPTGPDDWLNVDDYQKVSDVMVFLGQYDSMTAFVVCRR